jgi:DNA-binding LytR/AlgR family response regulator
MEKKIRVLILEDEFINLDLLRDYLEAAGYEISGDAMKADEAIEILEHFDTDIAILDIHVKGEKDGIWVAEQIRQHYHIPFIFLTAYSDPTTVKRAASVNPYGYLVKPFSQADIFTSIEIALKNYEKEDKELELPKEIMTETKELTISDFIFIKDNFMYKKILLADVYFIQSFKNYLEISLFDSRVVLRSTLQKISEILPKKYFAQTHRSFIVNIDFVESINAEYVMVGSKKVPLSKTYKDDFVRKLPFFT